MGGDAARRARCARSDEPLLCADAGLRTLPFDQSYDACLEEAHEVMYDVAERVMASAGVQPREVGLPAGGPCVSGCARVSMRSSEQLVHARASCRPHVSILAVRRECCLQEHTVCLPLNMPVWVRMI